MADEGKQTVAGAYAKIDAHEDLCAERYKGIHEAIGELRGTIKGASRLILGVGLAMLGWLAVQLYNEKTHPVPTVAVAVSPAPAAAR